MDKLKYFSGLKKEASVSKRYRELAKKYHPDMAVDDDEREHFTSIMQEINEEHKEVLILLKYKALEWKPVIKEPEQIVKNITSMFNLTQEQKKYFVEQGRNMLMTFYDNIIENNAKK